MNDSYSKILVPFDGSKYSQKALEIAIEVARTHGSVLYVVNVIDISNVNPPGLIRSKETQKSINQIENALRTSAELQLSKIQEHCKSLGVNAKVVVLEGQTSEKILRFANTNNVDLIVIGSRGLSGLSRIMSLGSVSRRISELTQCPVIIAR